MPRNRRGVTLLEVMIVVAIVGILSAIAAGGLRSLVVSTRVAQSGRVLASAFRQTRLRAVATQCPHFVQVNGPTYGGAANAAPGPSGFLGRRNMAAIYRKGDCTSAQASFVPGDVLVDSFLINDGPAGSLAFNVPAGVLPGPLGNNAVGVGYDQRGNRTVWSDMGGTGAGGFADVSAAFNGVAIAMTIRAVSGQSVEPSGVLTIPERGQVSFP